MASASALALLVLLLGLREARGHPGVTVTAAQEAEDEPSCEDSLSLRFQKAGLTRVDADFAYSPNVTCLSLEDNEIGFVAPGAFRLLPSLRYLNLARNRLALANFSRLEAGPQLRTLVLDGNAEPGAGGARLGFRHQFPRLRQLHLRRSGLVGVESLAFAPALARLYLSGNALGAAGPALLRGAPASLELVDLADSALARLDASGLAGLRELRLDGNRIRRVCGAPFCLEDSGLALAGAAGLRRLSLARNELASLEPDALEDARGLERLDLSHNRLDAVRRGTFGRQAGLRELSLAANRLSRVPDLRDLGALEVLSLAGNRLELVANESFARLPRLRLVDLSGNRIGRLEPEAFAKLEALETLRLSGNRLASLPGLWLLQLTSLRELHVDGNQIERLEDLKLASVRMYAKLERVHLQNNRITSFRLGSTYNTFRPLPNVTLEFFYTDANTSATAAQCECHCGEANAFDDVALAIH